MATATDGAMKAGAHAGNLIKGIAALVGGGGGGRPGMAQAGGKNPAGVDEALKMAARSAEEPDRLSPLCWRKNRNVWEPEKKIAESG